jgi:hypothetical protein
MQQYFSLRNRTTQCFGILILGLAVFQIATILKINEQQQQNRAQLTANQLDIVNRELAKDEAFLYDNPSLEEPIYKRLTGTIEKSPTPTPPQNSNSKK